MLKRYLLLIILMPLCLAAYPRETSKMKQLFKSAREALKNNRDQSRVEQELLTAMRDSAVTEREQAKALWTLSQLARSQNEQENLKLYLKQQYDTLRFFSTILNGSRYLLSLDSLERTTSVSSGHRKDIKALLLSYRGNLLGGGKFLLKRGKAKEAFEHFDTYVRLAAQPMFEQDHAIAYDTLLPHISYLATIAANNSDQPAKALTHIDYAIAGAESKQRETLMEYKATYQLAVGDTVGYLSTLLQGVDAYPRQDFFFLHLTEHYLESGLEHNGLELSDSLIAEVGARSIYHYTKSKLYLSLHDFDASIQSAQDAVALDGSMAEAYYNMGVSYLNKAINFAKAMNPNASLTRQKRDRVVLKGLYQYARTPMERYRELCPAESAKWAPHLYTIYLNLNLEQEFAEIEGLLESR